jgi:hypothetical protein
MPTLAQRQQSLDQGYARDIQPYLPAGDAGVGPMRRRAAERDMRAGRLQGAEKLLMNRKRLGYGTSEDALSQFEQKSLSDAAGATGNDPNVNLRQDQTPNVAAVSQYSLERLGTGLTPQEASAIRGPETEAVEAGAAESKRTMGNALAGAGVSPGSGASLAALGGIENQRTAGRADVERDVTTANLQRKQEIEQLAQQQGTIEEQQRASEVGTEQQRLQDIEGNLGQAATLAEGRREYDLGLTDARRNAQLQRMLFEQALRAAQPSGLEQASGIIGGIASGLKSSAG